MAIKLLNLLATATLAIVACSYGAQPTAAMATGNSHGDVYARHSHVSGAVQRKRAVRARRSNSSVCKTRSSAAAESSTKVEASTVEAIVESSTAVAETTSTTKKHKTSTSTTEKATKTADATTSSKAAATTTAAASSGGSSGNSVSTASGSPCSNKVGFSWNLGDDSALSVWSAGGGRCVYTWSSWPLDTASDAGSVVLPMLWGNSADKISDFQTNMPKYKDPTAVLFVNEPNESSQSNMSPEDAVTLWWDQMEGQAANGHTLCSPAVSSADDGFTWMKSFMSQCSTCSISCVATHWYGTDAQAFIDYQKKFIAEWGLPIIVTEFACNDFSGGAACSSDDAWSFLKDTTAWMNGEDNVWAYMAFGSLTDMVGVSAADQLLDTSNLEPNSLGWAYLNGFN